MRVSKIIHSTLCAHCINIFMMYIHYIQRLEFCLSADILFKTCSKIADSTFNSRSNLSVVSAFVSFTKHFPHSPFSLEQIIELNYLLGMMSTCDGCHDTVCAHLNYSLCCSQVHSPRNHMSPWDSLSSTEKKTELQ